METYLFDTDVLINLLRGEGSTTELMSGLSGSVPCTTSITYYELIKGCCKFHQPTRELHLVSGLMREFEMLNFDGVAAGIAGQIFADLEKKGQMINEADILIAAICITYRATLVTENKKDFRKVRELRVYGDR